jgi:hypothetical protein
MSQILIGEAAVAGLRVLAARPAAFGLWVLVNVAASLLGAVQILILIGPALYAMVQPSADLVTFSVINRYYGVSIAVALFAYPVLGAAFNRAILLPGPDRFGHLRVGLAEMRQFVVMLVDGTVLIGVLIATFFLLALVAWVVVWALTGADPTRSPDRTQLGFSLAALLALAVTLWIAARLSLSAPLSLSEGRLNLFGSWRLTRGQAWTIFAAHAIALLISLVLWFGALMLVGAIDRATGTWFAVQTIFWQSDIISTSLLHSPGRLASQIVMAVLVAMISLLCQAPGAAIYRSMTAGTSRTAIEDVFD